MDTKQKIEVMQAYVDGKPIEVAIKGECGRPIAWSLIATENPNWNWAVYDYRIAQDMELKAYNLNEGSVRASCLMPHNREWMRQIIDAVKRGEIY